MRRILIPQAIEMKEPITGKDAGKFTFEQFFNSIVLAQKAWGETLERLFMGADLKASLATAVKSEAKFWEVSDTLWELIYESIEKPSLPYQPTSMVQCVPFFRAIKNAEAFEG